MPKKKPEAINFIGIVDGFKTDSEGCSKITFEVPQSHQHAVRAIMEQHGRGEVLFAIAVIKLQKDEVYDPLDPVDEVFSG